MASGMLLNAAGLASTMGSLADAIPASGESNMHVACADLEGAIKERAPVDLGHLKGSYSYVVETNGDTVTGHVGTNVPYSEPQEQLYTPHVRPAVEAKQSELVQIMAADTLSDALSHVT